MKRKKLAQRILAEGEVTGHAHRVEVDVFEREDGFREFKGKTTVTHEEHKPIVLPEGTWVSGRIREYDHFQEMTREVQD